MSLSDGADYATRVSAGSWCTTIEAVNNGVPTSSNRALRSIVRKNTQSSNWATARYVSPAQSRTPGDRRVRGSLLHHEIILPVRVFCRLTTTPPHTHAAVAAPGLLQELAKLPPRDSLPGTLSPGREREREARKPRSSEETPPARLDEGAFLAALGQDECGTDVLRSSVEGFTRDTLALEAAIAKAQRRQQQ